MAGIRPFVEGDIPRVMDLHRRVFASRDGSVAPAAHQAYFKEMFFGNPWRSTEPQSLVFEDAGGEVVGFLGVVGREMVLDGRPVRAAIGSHFIVEPNRRATLAGIDLLRSMVSGPQDLTLADDANDLSRKVWEGLGGLTVPLYSLYWTRLLRPVELALTRWGAGRRGVRAMIPACRVVDAVLARVSGNPFRPPAVSSRGQDLDGRALSACLTEVAPRRALRPAYDGQAAAWLLRMLARRPGSGTVRKVLVRGADGKIAGWYVYCGHRRDVIEVLQVGAREEQIGVVLDHLFAQAWHEGALALVGRIDPRLMSAFSARRCFFHHRGGWMLIHSRDPELLQAIQRGDAFLSRLEGEWCARFQ